MIALVREIRRLSDASRLGSLKNKSSCARLHRSLSFRRYPFRSHASFAKVLYVLPPLGPCAALVGARVSTSLSSRVSLQLECNTYQWAQTTNRQSLFLTHKLTYMNYGIHCMLYVNVIIAHSFSISDMHLHDTITPCLVFIWFISVTTQSFVLFV